MPVARRTSPADANALLAECSAEPVIPRRCVRVVNTDDRIPDGRKAATTMIRGKNDTNALPASATLRSTNSVSSMRAHTSPTSESSNRALTRSFSARADAIRPRDVCSTRRTLRAHLVRSRQLRQDPLHRRPRPARDARPGRPFHETAGTAAGAVRVPHRDAEELARPGPEHHEVAARA